MSTFKADNDSSEVQKHLYDMEHGNLNSLLLFQLFKQNVLLKPVIKSN